MDIDAFKLTMSGRLVPIRGGVYAFVPNPLPPEISLDWKTASLLDEAGRALGELAGVGRMLPNPHLLIGPFLRREAILSSQIEGTIASMDQVLLLEVTGTAESADTQEVVNYVATVEYGLQRLQDLPVCLRLIRELHERLMADVRGAEQRPGEFRDTQNYVGRRPAGIEYARFVPPPVEHMTQSLNDLERFINNSVDLPPLVHLALVHYQFEAIHPFRDGNGRIGRALVTLQLCEKGLLPHPLLYLSGFFERNREEYIERLFKVSAEGAWLDWIRFFLRGVAEQSKDAVLRARGLLDLWASYREMLQTARSTGLLQKLVDHLFMSPALTARTATELLEVTPRSGQLAIDKLVEAGILVETTGKPRGRFYLARDIVKALQA